MWNTILVYMSKFLIDLMTQNIIITIPTVQSCHPLMNSSNTAKPRGVISKRKALALSLNSSSRASASARWRPGVLSPEAQMRNWINSCTPSESERRIARDLSPSSIWRPQFPSHGLLVPSLRRSAPTRLSFFLCFFPHEFSCAIFVVFARWRFGPTWVRVGLDLLIVVLGTRWMVPDAIEIDLAF